MTSQIFYKKCKLQWNAGTVFHIFNYLRITFIYWPINLIIDETLESANNFNDKRFYYYFLWKVFFLKRNERDYRVVDSIILCNFSWENSTKATKRDFLRITFQCCLINLAKFLELSEPFFRIWFIYLCCYK